MKKCAHYLMPGDPGIGAPPPAGGPPAGGPGMIGPAGPIPPGDRLAGGDPAGPGIGGPAAPAGKDNCCCSGFSPPRPRTNQMSSATMKSPAAPPTMRRMSSGFDRAESLVLLAADFEPSEDSVDSLRSDSAPILTAYGMEVSCENAREGPAGPSRALLLDYSRSKNSSIGVLVGWNWRGLVPGTQRP